MSILPLLAAAALASAAPAPPSTPETRAADAWSGLATSDLDSLEAILRDNHPGAVDPQNPAVRDWLSIGSRQARALADQATSYQGDVFALRRFVKGFNDSHVIIYESLPQTRAQYPGFLVALRGDTFVVVDSQEADVPSGARLESCDGAAPNAIYKTNIQPFYGVDGVRAEQVAYASYILADFGNPFITRPKTCRFVVGSDPRDVPLAWRSTPRSELLRRLRDAAHGASAELGLEEWRPGHFWIGLPDFAFTSDDGSLAPEVDQMNALIERARREAPRLRTAKAIVFDVRGNHGGSAVWGDKLLEAIWGKDFTDDLAQRAYTGVEWRTSPKNMAANRGYAAAYRAKFGDADSTYRRLTEIVSQMEAARARGEPLVQVSSDPPDPARARRPVVTPRVILLGNGSCYSACNDFSDAVLSIQGAELWGADNAADSVYIDNRGETLASGLFRVSLPMKVWRGRYRGNNVAYGAKRSVDTPLPSTRAAQAWVDEGLGETPRAAGPK